MQQTKSYWRVVAVAGVVGAFVASACVVTTSTDDTADGGAGTAAVAGTGGSSTAGTTSVAGSSGSTSIAGTSSVGGTSGSGGSGGTGVTAFRCDTDGVATGTPSSCAADPSSTCSQCTHDHCCAEEGACYATNPGNVCGYGGPNSDGQGEIICMLTCIQASTGDGGVADEELIRTCGNKCVTPKDSNNTACSGSVIGQQTNDLLACLTNSCSTECIGG